MFSAGKYSYGLKNSKPKSFYAPGITNVCFEDPTFDEHYGNPKHENYENICDLINCLGICHTVIAEKKVKNGEEYISYNASSPDELALVNGARYLGFAFRERDEEGDMIVDIQRPGQKAQVQKYKLLNLIEFDSARKRMSVVVRTPDDKIVCICKGADSIIEKRLKAGQQHLKVTQNFLEGYATIGLRTLLIAKRELNEEFYEKWSKKYHAAMTSINKEKEMNAVAEELEVEFELVGSTAIEDKLQDEVGRTIHDIKRAGIKVWVLTGDKVETAINIGYACRLLSNDMNIFILKETKPKRLRIEIVNLLAQQNITKRARENAVIVAGDTLTVIQKEDSLSKEFIELCSNANVVLACRVSPKQKAEVVRMMRAKAPTKSTLAIGDGANDVNMITAAHIGIGIAGLEGTQAARASDYSIGQFRFLRTLLFCHGRECYRRNTYLVSYMFYKNVLYVMPIFMFGFVSFFSGTVIYDVYMYQLYNVIFTGLPIIWFAIFDWEFDKAQLMRQPKLYRIGLEDVFFNAWVFWRWFFYAVWQGTLLCFLAFYTLDTSISTNGMLGCLINDGNFIFGTIVVVVNLKVLVSSYQYSFVSVAAAFTGIISFFIIFSWLSLWANYDLTGSIQHLFNSPETYLVLFFFASGYLLVDYGLVTANNEITQWMLRQKEIANYLARK